MLKSFHCVLSEKRKPIPTPKNICDENGKVHFGTFEKEFENMHFLKVHRPSCLPNFCNKIRLTLWEAVEVVFDDVIILTAVSDMALFGTALTVIYDRKTKKRIGTWQDIYSSSKAVIAPNLINGSVSESLGKKNKLKFVNNFQDGKAVVSGVANDKKCGTVKYNVKLERVSKPSIVIIPFDENRPLYSQKDLFKVNGFLEVNGKRYEANENTAAVIDDHRGYYPRKSHYDWVTTMGRNTVNGKTEYFGFNLTRNQSINQDDHNENLLWLENRSVPLTPVQFDHSDGKFGSPWHIYDEHGMVDILFEIGDENLMRIPAGIIDIDYHITFGELKGYVCDADGNKYILDGMPGIGEDKTMKF